MDKKKYPNIHRLATVLTVKQEQDHLFQAALETVGAMQVQAQGLIDAIVRGSPACAGRPCQCACFDKGAPCAHQDDRIICTSCQARATMHAIVIDYHVAMDAVIRPTRRHRRTREQAGPCTGEGSAPEPKPDLDPPRGDHPSFPPDLTPPH